ncbi:hypothetical protein TrLO_g234 [Triparma laevis f. longispina]|uniref:Peptidase A1 domain-containing protein n=1 Tax=Triparma laevis f. longispina TaxID=1714387 RepID=A0A9W7E0W9_9STRA|nr:hypothetical protein TrLO_g234 [Triparma laevis f. longispina]
MSRLIFLILSLLLPFLLPQTNSSPLPLTVLPSPLSPSHSLTFSIGTPPTTVTLIIDTGSHHLALPCSNLKNEDIWFDVGGSETAEYHDCMNCPEETECDGDRCTHTQSYSEGSKWSAQTLLETLYLPLPLKTTIYCVTEHTGLFNSQPENGLLGLARGADFFNGVGVGFEVCLTGNGGYIDFTSNPPPLIETNNGQYYKINIISISFNSQTLHCEPIYYNRGKGCILDTGTTDIYLPKDCEEEFRRVWGMETGVEFVNSEIYLDSESFKTLPTLTLHTEKLKFNIYPNLYMEPSNKLGYYTNRIYLEEQFGMIIGAAGLMYKSVWFGEEGVGWGDSLCW